jgi:cbb3-type cytochrome c oxidase subunit III
MVGSVRDVVLQRLLSRFANRTYFLITVVLIFLGTAAALNTASTQQPPPSGPEEGEYGEFRAPPKELAPVPVNDIAKSIRMNATALAVGRKVYDKNCAVCHGADLKGSSNMHAPDLTDANWRFSGDDLPSGGNVKHPSDVEWTVRYGVRSGHPNTRGGEADMLAFDPKYRTKDDIKEFGSARFLTPEEIGDVVEYVLKISGQHADAAKAARGDVLFHDGSKGNCFDCHSADGTGYDPIGSTNLTEPRLYLWGSDRTSILESINRGRRGAMPSFEGKLKPEEIKAVSVYVHSRAAR